MFVCVFFNGMGICAVGFFTVVIMVMGASCKYYNSGYADTEKLSVHIIELSSLIVVRLRACLLLNKLHIAKL